MFKMFERICWFIKKDNKWCNKDYIRVVSCNTTGLCRTLHAVDKQYGIDNVRGGSYCKMVLEEEVKKLIQKEIYTSENKCFNCG